MEPQNIVQNEGQDVNQTSATQPTPEEPVVPQSPQTETSAETSKPTPEEPPVIINWKKPIIKILIVGAVAIALMYILKKY